MAMENELITADMVEASEYAELSDKYQVYAVPLTVANDKIRIEGGMPEQMFIAKILQEMGVNAGSSKS
jgi:predicted DsbA family dithiol-disulfide isomerase